MQYDATQSGVERVTNSKNVYLNDTFFKASTNDSHSDIESKTGSKIEKKHWFEDARQLKHL